MPISAAVVEFSFRVDIRNSVVSAVVSVRLAQSYDQRGEMPRDGMQAGCR